MSFEEFISDLDRKIAVDATFQQSKIESVSRTAVLLKPYTYVAVIGVRPVISKKIRLLCSTLISCCLRKAEITLKNRTNDSP